MLDMVIDAIAAPEFFNSLAILFFAVGPAFAFHLWATSDD